LRAQKINLAGRKRWCESNDPEFAAKAAEIVGLYLDRPGSVTGAKPRATAIDERCRVIAVLEWLRQIESG
jgi:hypothetical protein